MLCGGATQSTHRSACASARRSGLVQRLLIDRVTEQAVSDLGDVDVAEVVDEIAPGVGDPADPRDKGHDAADFQSLRVHRPSADKQRADNLELSAQVHQEVHRELEAVDSHVELEYVLDALVVGPIPRVVAADSLDDADAELPYDLDARSLASSLCALHQRNEDQLGHEERERRAGHPKIDMDHVSQHRK